MYTYLQTRHHCTQTIVATARGVVDLVGPWQLLQPPGLVGGMVSLDIQAYLLTCSTPFGRSVFLVVQVTPRAPRLEFGCLGFGVSSDQGTLVICCIWGILRPSYMGTLIDLIYRSI